MCFVKFEEILLDNGESDYKILDIKPTRPPESGYILISKEILKQWQQLVKKERKRNP